MNELKDFKDDVAKKLFGMTKTEAIEKGVCLHCGDPALKNCYSEAGAKEYTISGLCEYCFDAMFKEGG